MTSTQPIKSHHQVGIPEVGVIAVLTVLFVMSLSASLLWFYSTAVCISAFVLVLAIGLCLLERRGVLLYLAMAAASLGVGYVYLLSVTPVQQHQVITYAEEQVMDSSQIQEARMAWDVVLKCPQKFQLNPEEFLANIRHMVRLAYTLRTNPSARVTGADWYRKFCG